MILRVLWNDACSSGGTLWAADLKYWVEKEYLVDSIGHLAASTDDAIAISRDYHHDDSSIRYALRVPKEYVREIEHLSGPVDEKAIADWMKPFLEVKAEAEAG